MKIFITGSNGFLGTFLKKKLAEQGHELINPSSKDCNLTISDSLEKYNDTKFDQIFHLAAWTQAGDFCLKHPGEQWIINQKINTHVLDWWSKCQPQAKMICMGTSCGYDPNHPLKEEYYMMGEPIESLFSYGMTKKMLLCGLMSLHKQYNLDYLYIVPSTLYGPNYHTDGRQMHFIFDLIRKILRGKRFGDDVVLWGDGLQKREIIHVEDFIDAMLVLNMRIKNQIVNIGSGAEYSIREFASEICQIVGYDESLIKYDTSKYVGARSKILNISKLQSIYPDLQMKNLSNGLQSTIDWFIESYK